MSISRLDCDIFRGEGVVPDASSYVVLNPGLERAQAAFVGATAVAEGIGSQVAYTLGLEYFVRGLLESSSEGDSFASEEQITNVLEDAFRIANSSVYNFGHKLAAGGRMAASMMACVVSGASLVAGRVGSSSVYLYRDAQLFPLFPSDGVDTTVIGDIGEELVSVPDQRLSYIGAHAIVDVSIASVNMEPGDTVVIFSRPLTGLNETLLFQYLEITADTGSDGEFGRQVRRAEDLCLDVFTDPDTVSFCCLLSMGPDTIYCSKVVG